MEITALDTNMFVGPQISTTDLEELAYQGITHVICNRPDKEHLGEPSSQQIGARAQALGLAYHYLPITPGEPFEDQALALADILSEEGAKVFAYCRSGARATNAWLLAQAQIAEA